MSLSIATLDPSDLGLPEQFSEFRQCQIEAVDHVLSSDKRFIGLSCPVGSGKSLISVTLAKALRARTAILTATRGLQDQYRDMFSCCGMVDIRGKANYQCDDLQHLSCRFAGHEGCRYHKKVCTADGDEMEVVDESCTYKQALRKAQWANLVVTNYQFWVRCNVFGRGLEPPPKEGSNPVDLLILDEQHAAMSELSRAIGLTLREDRLMDLGMRGYPRSDDIGDWNQWAAANSASCAVLLKSTIQDLRHCQPKDKRALRDRVYQLEELNEGLEKIVRIDKDNWVLEMILGTDHGRKWEFNCVWPGAWAESRLYLGVPKIVMMSGTLRPQTMKMLGVPKDQMDYREWPRQFPAQNTPVYHIRSGVRLNHSTPDEKKLEVVQKMDEIIEKWGRRYKGLVQTVSYKNQRFILANSKYADCMLANTQDPDSDSAAEVVEKFRNTPEPKDGPYGLIQDGEQMEGTLLVSPSFGTGWDFSDSDARFIIIFKMPYPEFMSKVTKARIARSPNYTQVICMQELLQQVGRATRSESDWSFVAIIDDGLTYFMKVNRNLAPSYFQPMKRDQIPEIW